MFTRRMAVNEKNYQTHYADLRFQGVTPEQVEGFTAARVRKQSAHCQLIHSVAEETATPAILKSKTVESNNLKIKGGKNNGKITRI